MEFSQTRFSLRRPLTSYSKVQRAVSVLVRNRPFHIRQSVRDKHYLDLGCGPNTDPRFINLDYGWRPDIDICWDITRGLPLADGAVQGIFSEHCLEHIPLPSADRVLSECRRVLRPGGVLRLIVPDGELYLSRYTQGLDPAERIALPYADEDAFRGLYSPIMSVNRIFRSHGHQFIYDFETLRMLLESHGFIGVAREGFGSGRNPILLRDNEHRAVESLYVECETPD